MVNLPDLGERLQGAGIINKSFHDCTRTEILFICQAVFSSIGDDVPVWMGQAPHRGRQANNPF